MNAMRSGPVGAGVAQVQCTPWPPTQVAPAAAGMPAEPSAAEPMRGGPWRAGVDEGGALAGGDRAFDHDAAGDAGDAALGRPPLGREAGRRLLLRVGDV